MTALAEFSVLTSSGFWRRDPNAAKCEVFISFHDATLVLSDNTGAILSHWSLPAVRRMDEGGTIAVFSPDPKGLETLEVQDTTMIRALASIAESLRDHKPKPSRYRFGLGSIAILVVLAGVILGLPKILNANIRSAMGPKAYIELDGKILRAMSQQAGRSCSQAPRALAQLTSRVDAPILVLSGDLAGPTTLPGGTILLDRMTVEHASDPNIVAGYALVARAASEDALNNALDTVGITSKLSLLSSGTLSDEDALNIATSFVQTGQPAPTANEIIEAFTAANIPLRPWVNHLTASNTSLGLDQADLQILRGRGNTQDQLEFPPIMSDQQWIALQNICVY